MTSWIIFFYFFVLGAAMLLSVLGVWFTIIMPGADRWNRCFFRSFFIVLLLDSFIVLMELILHYKVSRRFAPVGCLCGLAFMRRSFSRQLFHDHRG